MNYMTDVWFLVPNWKWIVFIVAAISGVLIQALLTQVIARLKKSERIHKKVKYIHYFVELEIEKPLAWIITAAFWLESVDNLVLPEGLSKYLRLASHVLIVFYSIRLAYMAVDAFGKQLADYSRTTENTLDDQLAPFATKSLKFLVVVFGLLLILQNLGFNVMSLLAGLGLGGLALALAAQDTAANVFGSITIILDRPFQVGDLVKVADTEGTIEDIGFRSTRIRTLYGSLVSIPNSVMAKEKIDNMGARAMRRIRHVLGLSYDTSEEQMKAFIDKVRYILTQHSEIDSENVTVSFNAMGDFNLQVLVQFFIKTTDPVKELEVQQEILFELMNTAKNLGIEFAFPTSTVHYKSVEPALAPASAQQNPQ